MWTYEHKWDILFTQERDVAGQNIKTIIAFC